MGSVAGVRALGVAVAASIRFLCCDENLSNRFRVVGLLVAVAHSWLTCLFRVSTSMAKIVFRSGSTRAGVGSRGGCVGEVCPS